MLHLRRSLLLSLSLLPWLAGAALAQPTGVEARLRALEARMSAMEARLGAAAPAAASGGPECARVTANIYAFPESRLSLSVNGRSVGGYQKSTNPELTGLMRPGPNVIAYAFEGLGVRDRNKPHEGVSEFRLMCLPPGDGSRMEILNFQPQAGRMEGQTAVTLAPR